MRTLAAALAGYALYAAGSAAFVSVVFIGQALPAPWLRAVSAVTTLAALGVAAGVAARRLSPPKRARRASGAVALLIATVGIGNLVWGRAVEPWWYTLLAVGLTAPVAYSAGRFRITQFGSASQRSM